MPRSRFLLSLFAVAALAAVAGATAYPDDSFVSRKGVTGSLGKLGGGWSAALSVDEFGRVLDYPDMDAARACGAGGCQAVTLDLVSAVPEPPVVALLAAGLALGLARGNAGFRRPVRRRRG